MTIASLPLKISLPAAPEDVWQLVGHFRALADWNPMVQSSQIVEGGDKAVTRRVVTLHGGQQIVEELRDDDRADKTYSYRVIEGPVGIKDYQAILQVTKTDFGCDVAWSYQPPASCTSTSQALAGQNILQSMVQQGMESLGQMFKPPKSD